MPSACFRDGAHAQRIGVADGLARHLADPVEALVHLREVRVRVWWGDNLEEEDQVELTTHIINESGVVREGGFSGLGGMGGGGGQ